MIWDSKWHCTYWSNEIFVTRPWTLITLKLTPVAPKKHVCTKNKYKQKMVRVWPHDRGCNGAFQEKRLSCGHSAFIGRCLRKPHEIRNVLWSLLFVVGRWKDPRNIEDSGFGSLVRSLANKAFVATAKCFGYPNVNPNIPRAWEVARDPPFAIANNSSCESKQNSSMYAQIETRHKN